MFILRQVSQDGVETTRTLGDVFCIIHKEKSPSEFEEISKGQHGEKCYGFISYSGLNEPLFVGEQYYIMTGSGETFDNVTLKSTKPRTHYNKKDLVDFGNYLMKLIKDGNKQSEPDGGYLVSDANIQNWKHEIDNQA